MTISCVDMVETSGNHAKKGVVSFPLPTGPINRRRGVVNNICVAELKQTATPGCGSGGSSCWLTLPQPHGGAAIGGAVAAAVTAPPQPHAQAQPVQHRAVRGVGVG